MRVASRVMEKENPSKVCSCYVYAAQRQFSISICGGGGQYQYESARASKGRVPSHRMQNIFLQIHRARKWEVRRGFGKWYAENRSTTAGSYY